MLRALKTWLCLAFIIGGSYILSAGNYGISNIAGDLKKDAHAVVRFDSVYVNIDNIKGYTYSEEKVITVLDGSLERLGIIGVPYSDREVVNNLKAWLYDAEGSLVKHAEINALDDISITGNILAGSARAKVLNMGNPKAPFTIKYSFQKQVTGTAFLPVFMPATEFDESIEKAKISITVDSGLALKFNPVHLGMPAITGTGYAMELTDVGVIKSEAYASLPGRVLPRLNMMLGKFDFYDLRGSAESWDDIGRFINAMSQGNTELKHITDHELNDIFESKQADVDKVKGLFGYLEHNFHYAGIEVGIGGWRPEEAQVTLKKKYGDCKGLVTVLKALLKKAGIESYYTLINADNISPDINSDFPCLDFNHVILCVPLNNDTLWMECTSPEVPFNYLYNSTSNRLALLVYPGGGRLITTPAHNETFNRCGSIVHIKLNEENVSVINAETSLRGDLQDTIRHVAGQNNQTISETVVYHTLHLKNTIINSVSIKQVDRDSPLVVTTLALSNESAIKRTDARIFIKTDLFTPVPYIPDKNDNRAQPVNVATGYWQADTIYYNLPIGFIPENFKPGEPKNITGLFGFAGCTLKYSSENGELMVTRNFCLKTGTYGKEQFTAFRDFLLQAAKTICPEIVLRKKG